MIGTNYNHSPTMQHVQQCKHVRNKNQIKIFSKMTSDSLRISILLWTIHIFTKDLFNIDLNWLTYWNQSSYQAS